MSVKMKNKIEIEYEGFLSQQFSHKKEQNDLYWPSAFLQGLMGRVAEQFKDVGKKVTEASIEESGYKVTIKVNRND